MVAKANESNLLSSYRMADPEGRLEIMFANYHIFPKVIIIDCLEINCRR